MKTIGFRGYTIFRHTHLWRSNMQLQHAIAIRLRNRRKLKRLLSSLLDLLPCHPICRTKEFWKKQRNFWTKSWPLGSLKRRVIPNLGTLLDMCHMLSMLVMSLLPALSRPFKSTVCAMGHSESEARGTDLWIRYPIRPTSLFCASSCCHLPSIQMFQCMFECQQCHIGLPEATGL